MIEKVHDEELCNFCPSRIMKDGWNVGNTREKYGINTKF
jgi:hypothetical protein